MVNDDGPLLTMVVQVQLKNLPVQRFDKTESIIAKFDVNIIVWKNNP